MNKRQAKKREKREKILLDIWGYFMTYKEQREMQREYHENVIVNTYYRNSNDFSDLEELEAILGIPFERREYRYNYPNRFRFRTIEKLK